MTCDPPTPWRAGKAFLIAEAGVNHNGDLALARQLVEVAARAGADAVKFQTFRSERLVTAGAPKAEYQKRATGETESQGEMLRRLELSEAAHRQLMDDAARLGILFLSTPFDEDSADLLQAMGLSAFKISSGDLTNLPFLAHLAGKRKPLILSTGMSTLGEVEAAVVTIADAGNPPLALLHCVSNYPADPADANLRAMDTLRRAFGLPVGFSDHTTGIEIALAATALGAAIVEKHFTLSRDLPGPDHRASLEPPEMEALVRAVRNVELSLGDGVKRPRPAERNVAAVARRSLVAACDLAAGVALTREMVAVRRPGTGLPPALLPSILGRTLRSEVRAGSLLAWSHFL